MGGVSSIAFFLDFFKFCKSPYAVYVCDNIILQWLRFRVNPGFYPPTLPKCLYLDISIHDVHVLYSWGTDVLLLALRRVPFET